jgi:hypothetical protein
VRSIGLDAGEGVVIVEQGELGGEGWADGTIAR